LGLLPRALTHKTIFALTFNNGYENK
jgi:hypothetical protein